MANGDCIEPSDIELDPMHHSAATLSAPQRLQETPAPARTASTAMDMESVEREHILHVLSQVAGNRRKAVAVLGLSERTLRYKLKAYREQFPDLLIPEGS
jgi:two-component system response regulator FlrC